MTGKDVPSQNKTHPILVEIKIYSVSHKGKQSSLELHSTYIIDWADSGIKRINETSGTETEIGKKYAQIMICYPTGSRSLYMHCSQSDMEKNGSENKKQCDPGFRLQVAIRRWESKWS